MRIIAGRHRGRTLVSPEGRGTTRPITDRVKQSLFDRLVSGGEVSGAVVLDLFAGTGSMGLECLSRDAEHVIFVERDRRVRARLEENLAALREADRATVLNCDALGGLLLTTVGGRDLSLVFVDPPYRLMTAMGQRVYDQIGRLAEACEPGAVLVLRTPSSVAVPAIAPWGQASGYVYGSMALHHFVLGG